MRRNRSSLKFQGRSHSIQGIVSLVIGLATWLFFLIMFIVSTKAKGTSNVTMGFFGLLDAALSLVGIRFAMRAFKEKDVFYTEAFIGLALSGGHFIFMLII
ncbi:MAG: hypothetical protein K6B75_00610, partial [Lachnospiraceae bacterium]|nr:hypothetical protein [Lachnospiraceae bacterium]